MYSRSNERDSALSELKIPLVPIEEATVLLAGTGRDVASLIVTEIKHLLSLYW